MGILDLNARRRGKAASLGPIPMLQSSSLPSQGMGKLEREKTRQRESARQGEGDKRNNTPLIQEWKLISWCVTHNRHDDHHHPSTGQQRRVEGRRRRVEGRARQFKPGMVRAVAFDEEKVWAGEPGRGALL